MASTGARAYMEVWGKPPVESRGKDPGQRAKPLELMTFVFKTLIFDAPVIVFTKINVFFDLLILMIRMLPFNVAQRAFKDTHCVINNKIIMVTAAEIAVQSIDAYCRQSL